MRLIKAQREHLAKLVELSKAAFESDVTVGADGPGGPPDYDSMEWHIQMLNGGHLFTALEENRIVGGAAVFRDSHNRALMHIGRIFVDPEWFHRGLGTQIMEQLEELYSDIVIWDLDTPLWNRRTNSFYQKLGYIETHRDQDFVYYQKKKQSI